MNFDNRWITRNLTLDARGPKILLDDNNNAPLIYAYQIFFNGTKYLYKFKYLYNKYPINMETLI